MEKIRMLAIEKLFRRIYSIQHFGQKSTDESKLDVEVETKNIYII